MLCRPTLPSDLPLPDAVVVQHMFAFVEAQLLQLQPNGARAGNSSAALASPPVFAQVSLAVEINSGPRGGASQLPAIPGEQRLQENKLIADCTGTPSSCPN